MLFSEAKDVVSAAFALREANPGVYGGSWSDGSDAQILECFSPINGAPLGRVT